MFSKIKKFFKLKIYTKKELHAFVVKGVITAEQYETITGDKYNSG